MPCFGCLCRAELEHGRSGRSYSSGGRSRSSSSGSSRSSGSLTSIVSASNSSMARADSSSSKNEASPTSATTAAASAAPAAAEAAAEAALGFSDLYTVESTIGSGSYAVVYRCVHRQSLENFAVKVIEDKMLSGYQRQLIRNEEAILRRLDHRNVIKLVAVFTNEQDVKRMVFEFADQLDVCMALVTDPDFGEAAIKSVAQQLLRGLRYLHSEGIVHRDLKLENLLVKSDTSGSGSKVVKICDFGYAVTLAAGQTFFTMKNIIIGSFEYMSPELISSQEYSTKMDCWAAGVVVYFLFTGDFPFKGNTVPDMVRCVVRRTFSLGFAEPEWAAASPNAVEFIKSILLPLYSRPTAKELLKHAWFKAPLTSTGNAVTAQPLPIMRQSERLQFLQQEADAKLRRLYNNSSSSKRRVGTGGTCWPVNQMLEHVAATRRYRNRYCCGSHEATLTRELQVHSFISVRRRAQSLGSLRRRGGRPAV